MYLKSFLALCCCLPLLALGQKKGDRSLDHLQRHAQALAGEPVPVYMEAQFRALGLQPASGGAYVQAFPVDRGKRVDSGTFLRLNDTPLQVREGFIPLPYSAGGAFRGEPLVSVQEPGRPWIVDIAAALGEGWEAPAYDLQDALYGLARQAAGDRAAAVLFYAAGSSAPLPPFDSADRRDTLPIPVLYLSPRAADRFLGDQTASVKVEGAVVLGRSSDTGRNVIAVLDNGAPSTLIIAAPYREDAGHALLADSGNAEGLAELLALAARLKDDRRARNRNYAFIAFCASEGLPGLPYFSEHPTLDLGRVEGAIALDGRPLGPVPRVSGAGSSPGWARVLEDARDRRLNPQLDSGAAASPLAGWFAAKHIPFISVAPAAGTGQDAGLQVVRYVSGIAETLSRGQRLTPQAQP